MMKKNVLAKKILCGLLAAGVLGVAGSAMAAESTGFSYSSSKTIKDEEFIINSFNKRVAAAGIQTNSGSIKTLTVNSKKFIINQKPIAANDNIGVLGLMAWGAKANIGNEDTSEISINVTDNVGTYQTIGVDSETYNSRAASVNLTADSIVINAIGNNQSVVGIWAQNNNDTTIPDDGDNVSEVIINADKTTINVKNENSGGNEIGIAAYSGSRVVINSDLEVNSDKVISTRGNAITKINEDGTHTVKLNGDIDFNITNDGSSGTKADAKVILNLSNADSYLNGSINKSLTGDSTGVDMNVSGMTTNISNGAAWNMTGDSFVNTANVSDGGSINVQDKVKKFDADNVALNKGNLNIQGENSKGAAQNISITKLSNDAGAINMQGSAQNLEITDLSSNDGTINMQGSKQNINVINDFVSNNTTINLQGEDQNINLKSMSGSGAIVNTNSLDNGVNIGEKADGTEIAVKGSSAITDQIASGQATLQQLANVVGKAETGSETSLADTVTSEANDIIGGYYAEVGKDGKIIAGSEKTYENTTNRAISDMASISLMTWRQENNDMNKRLGELRDSKGEHGAWARMARGESKYGAQNVKNQYNYYQVGYDEKLSVNPNWTVGVALTRTEGNSTFAAGSGENKHTGFAVYGSYLNDNGSFIDLIAKYARMDNEYKTIGAGVGDADYETNGYSLSAEYGKRFTKDNGFWIEPQVELTYGTVGSANYTTSRGNKVYQESVDSLVARLGFSLGKNIKQGNIYARASYLYDFDGETKATMTGAGSATFEQDLGGGWWEVGVGTNINLSDATHLYFDVEKTYGGNVATPWQWNAGVRWSF